MYHFKFPTPVDVALSGPDFTVECERISAAIRAGTRTIDVHTDIAKHVSDLLRESGWTVSANVTGSRTELAITIRSNNDGRAPLYPFG